MDRHDEVHAGEDRGEAEDEHTSQCRDGAAHRPCIRGRIGAVWRVEGPARIQSAREQGQHEEQRADDPQE